MYSCYASDECCACCECYALGVIVIRGLLFLYVINVVCEIEVARAR